MIGPGDEDQQCCSCDIEEKTYAVVENILADGNHDIACYHQHEGETSDDNMSATSFFKYGDDEGQ